MLSFQIVNAGNSIAVYCDSNGLDQLINALTSLRKSLDIGHIHMLALSAGGGILNDQNPWGEAAINEVILSFAQGEE